MHRIHKILDFSSDRRVTPQIAAAFSLMVTHEEGLPSALFLSVPGTQEALDILFSKLEGLESSSSQLLIELILDELYSQSTPTAAMLCGHLYAQMIADRVGAAEAFKAAVCANVNTAQAPPSL